MNRRHCKVLGLLVACLLGTMTPVQAGPIIPGCKDCGMRIWSAMNHLSYDIRVGAAPKLRQSVLGIVQAKRAAYQEVAKRFAEADSARDKAAKALDSADKAADAHAQLESLGENIKVSGVEISLQKDLSKVLAGLKTKMAEREELRRRDWTASQHSIKVDSELSRISSDIAEAIRTEAEKNGFGDNISRVIVDNLVAKQ